MSIPQHHSTEELLRYLFFERADVESRFDSHYKDRLTPMYTECVRLFNALQEAQYSSSDNQLSEGTNYAVLILWKCVKTILSSIQLLRAGYWSEASSVLRDAIESATIAYHLHLQPKSLDVFEKQGAGKLYGKAMEDVRKLIPTLKKNRDLLSEFYVHPNGFSGVIEWRGERFSMTGAFDKEELQRYEFVILLQEAVLRDIGKLIEYIFSGLFEKLLYWQVDEGGGKKMRSTTPKDLDRILESTKAIKDNKEIDLLADDPGDNEEMKATKATLRSYRDRKKK